MEEPAPVIKTAADIPTTYLAPRKELQQQAARKAGRWGASWEYLPVLGGGGINDGAVREGVEIVRDRGKHLLRDYWSLLDLVDEPVFTEDDEESVDIDRPTCPCAEGEQAYLSGISVTRRLNTR